MENNMRYRILESDNGNTLSDMVNKHLSEDWELYGNLVATSLQVEGKGDGQLYLYQAVITNKNEDVVKNEDVIIKVQTGLLEAI